MEEEDVLRVGGPDGFCTVSWISNPGMATPRGFALDRVACVAKSNDLKIQESQKTKGELRRAKTRKEREERSSGEKKILRGEGRPGAHWFLKRWPKT